MGKMMNYLCKKCKPCGAAAHYRGGVTSLPQCCNIVTAQR